MITFKKNILMLVLIVMMSFVHAQETPKKTRNELKRERNEKKADLIQNFIEQKRFIFIPYQAMSMTGGSINLTGSFEAIIKNDSLFSYLPFYGVAYRIDYGSTNSALSFQKQFQDFSNKKVRNGYRIEVKVSNNSDRLTYVFQISATCYTTLTVNSIHRQPISFYGKIDSIPDKK